MKVDKQVVVLHLSHHLHGPVVERDDGGLLHNHHPLLQRERERERGRESIISQRKQKKKRPKARIICTLKLIVCRLKIILTYKSSGCPCRKDYSWPSCFYLERTSSTVRMRK